MEMEDAADITYARMSGNIASVGHTMDIQMGIQTACMRG